MPGAGQSSPSRLSFWPEPVERFISDYRAALDADGADAPFTPPAATGWQPAGTPTVPGGGGSGPSVPLAGDSTVRTGRHGKDTAVRGVSRRTVLAALAGAVTAGVGIGGWELADHLGGSAPRKLASFTLPAVTPGKLAWKYDAGASVSYAAQSGNRVFVATNGNRIAALNAATGKPVWQRTVTSQLNDSLVIAGGAVVIAGENGPYALSAATGKQLWSIKTGETDWLTAAGGVVFIGYAAKVSTTGGMTAVDPATGILLWTNPLGKLKPGNFWDSEIGGMPTVADGHVYTAGDNGYLYGFDVKSGKPAKAGSFGNFGAGSIAAMNGVVYAGANSDKGAVLAVRLATGKKVWETDLGKAGFEPYTATDGHLVYAGTVPHGNTAAGDSLVALNPADGKKVWGAPVRGGVNQGPYVSGGVVYTGGGIEFSTGILQAWQGSTGKQLWEYTVPDSLAKITAVTGQRVYTGAGHLVYSIGA
jgi:outer membrane protein assembly factor BamB